VQLSNINLKITVKAFSELDDFIKNLTTISHDNIRESVTVQP